MLIGYLYRISYGMVKNNKAFGQLKINAYFIQLSLEQNHFFRKLHDVSYITTLFRQVRVHGKHHVTR